MSGTSEKNEDTFEEFQQQVNDDVEKSGGIHVIRESDVVHAHAQNEHEEEKEKMQEYGEEENDKEQTVENVQEDKEERGKIPEDRDRQIKEDNHVFFGLIKDEEQGKEDNMRLNLGSSAQPVLNTHTYNTTDTEQNAEGVATSQRFQSRVNQKLQPLNEPLHVEIGRSSAKARQLMPVQKRTSLSLAKQKANFSSVIEPISATNSMTTSEEYRAFRARNSVASNYKGPVFVVEDVYVMCAQCGTPVDPITRVPAGKLFFHPHCISCKLCGCRNITEAYFKATRHDAICSTCAVKGYKWWVSREESLSCGIIPGAVKGSLEDAIELRNCQSKRQQINQSTVEGAIPPTLSLGPLYNRVSHPVKMLLLIQRQQYYTQNDNNILCVPPSRPKKASVTSGAVGVRERKASLQRLM